MNIIEEIIKDNIKEIKNDNIKYINPTINKDNYVF